jgi:adenine phosphoribosyltransferase
MQDSVYWHKETAMNDKLTSRVISAIRNIPDFPRKGILFKDLTPVFRDPVLFRDVVEELTDYYAGKGITRVVGIESRGFIFGSAIALRLGAGFIPVRKPGKLPAATFRKEYSLEYGKDSVEIHKDALTPGEVVLLHDDLLATGGTSKAAYDLIGLFNVKKVYLNFICELSFLHGRSAFKEPAEIFSLVQFGK